MFDLRCSDETGNQRRDGSSAVGRPGHRAQPVKYQNAQLPYILKL